jgi:hypothetical protein
VGNGRPSTGLDPQCPLEYSDSVYLGTTLTDGRFIGQSPSVAWPSYYSLRLIKDENGINKQTAWHTTSYLEPHGLESTKLTNR